MARTATATTIAETLALPAMKLLATLNVLFLVSFIAVFCMAVAR
ncbi:MULTISPECIES: hypothetical protein [Mesorhizobium]|nr:MULTISPECIES: hypothetical protein [Mesorhizobium]